MLFRQKGKTPDVGKDNFQEFMRREKDSIMLTNKSIGQPTYSRDNASSHNHTYSHNQTQQKQKPYATELTSDGQFILPSAHQLILDGSCKAAGTTWDATHLDSFLKTSKFAQTGEHVFKTNFQRQALPIDSHAQTGVKESFFMRNKQPRLGNDKSDAHYIYWSSSNYPGSETEPKKTTPFRSIESKHQREKVLEKFTNANPTVEFDNQKYASRPNDNRTDAMLNRHQQLFPLQNYEMHYDWAKKRDVKEPFVEEKRNTNDRLFGNNLNEIKAHTITQRALYLRAQELRGKDYDLITMSKNDLPVLQ